MGFFTDKDQKCGTPMLSFDDPTEDEYGDPLPRPVCNWVTTSTYSDECTVCGAIALYN